MARSGRTIHIHGTAPVLGGGDSEGMRALDEAPRRTVEVTMAAALRRRVVRKQIVLLQLEGGEGRLNAHIARDPLCASERLPADLHQRRAAPTPQFVKCVAERKMRRSLEDAACRQLGDAERKDLNELRPLARKL